MEASSCCSSIMHINKTPKDCRPSFWGYYFNEAVSQFQLVPPFPQCISAVNLTDCTLHHWIKDRTYWDGAETNGNSEPHHTQQGLGSLPTLWPYQSIKKITNIKIKFTNFIISMTEHSFHKHIRSMPAKPYSNFFLYSSQPKKQTFIITQSPPGFPNSHYTCTAIPHQSKFSPTSLAFLLDCSCHPVSLPPISKADCGNKQKDSSYTAETGKTFDGCL